MEAEVACTPIATARGRTTSDGKVSVKDHLRRHVSFGSSMKDLRPRPLLISGVCRHSGSDVGPFVASTRVRRNPVFQLGRGISANSILKWDVLCWMAMSTFPCLPYAPLDPAWSDACGPCAIPARYEQGACNMMQHLNVLVSHTVLCIKTTHAVLQFASFPSSPDRYRGQCEVVKD
jgi:hypothetical protein